MMELPNWIKKDCLEKSLQLYLNNAAVEITKIASVDAVPTGENYTSDLFRAAITYKINKSEIGETLSVIIKCIGANVAKNAIALNAGIFEKETFMYSETLPKLHQILGENCITADCLLSQLKPNPLIVLRDLLQLNYRMENRSIGLDIDKCLIIMEKIAKLHASSAVLYEKDPHSMDNYTKGLFTNQHESELIYQFAMGGFESLAIATSKWNGFEKYSKKLFALINSGELYKKCMDLAIPKAGQFSVLNHGDLWTNNILFLYDEMEKLKDIKFIDFQFSIFTTPALDLQYFLSSSTINVLDDKTIIKILQVYHKHLVDKLNELNYSKNKIPSFEQLYKDFKDLDFYGIITVAVILGMVRSPASEDATFEELMKQDNKNGFRNRQYNCKEYRSIVEQLLPRYDAAGLLDLKY